MNGVLFGAPIPESYAGVGKELQEAVERAVQDRSSSPGWCWPKRCRSRIPNLHIKVPSAPIGNSSRLLGR